MSQRLTPYPWCQLDLLDLEPDPKEMRLWVFPIQERLYMVVLASKDVLWGISCLTDPLKKESAFEHLIQRLHLKLNRREKGALLSTKERLCPWQSSLERFFRKEPITLSIALPSLGAFQRKTLLTACDIEVKTTWTYGQLARAIDKPQAARAVGQALNKNPLGVLLPCHRIVGKGWAGGYRWGMDVKAALLQWEGQ